METDDVFVGLRHEYGGEQPFAIGVSERRQHVYAISVDRRIQHPAGMAIVKAARHDIFA